MFTAALFTIAKKWEQHKMLHDHQKMNMDKEVTMVCVYIHTHLYTHRIANKKRMKFCHLQHMDGFGGHYAK